MTNSLLTTEQACYHAVHDYPGGVAGVAGVYGWSANTLQNKLNPTQNTHKLSALDAETILELTKDGRILDAMCSRFGAIWIDLRKVSGVASDMAMLDNVTDLVTKVGELTSTISKSLDDGVVKPDEARELEACTLRLTQAAYTVLERAKQFM